MDLLKTAQRKTLKVYVLETNIENYEQIKAVAPTLDSMDGVLKWTVDTEDVSNALRIEAMGLSCDQLIKSVRRLGFQIEEMRD